MERAPPLRVLGIDPGTRRMGWALLEGGTAAGVVHLASGVLAAPARRPPAERLGSFLSELARLLDLHRPGCVALESPFFGKNALSMLRLGEARGAVIALAGSRGLAAFDHPPARVKRRVTGSGAASKAQVARALRVLLPSARALAADTPPDQTDAIAVAWCHLLEHGRAHAAARVEGRTAVPADDDGPTASRRRRDPGALAPSAIAAAIGRWQRRRR